MRRCLILLCIVVLAGGAWAGWITWRWVNPQALSDDTHIIVDAALNRLYIFENRQLVRQYTVSTGHEVGITPHGCYTIVTRWELEDDAASALGSHWLGLSAPPGPKGGRYGIHGTDEPHLIGQHVSAGCIRMRPEDIADLYRRVSVGTMVCIKEGPTWLWWLGDWLQERGIL